LSAKTLHARARACAHLLPVPAHNALRLGLDFFADLLEVFELFLRTMQELAKLLALALERGRRLLKLQNERRSRHNARAPRQEIAPHDAFQDLQRAPPCQSRAREHAQSAAAQSPDIVCASAGGRGQAWCAARSRAAENRALATALASNDDDLRQLNRPRLAAVLNDGRDILQLVDDGKQMVQPAPHRPYQRRGHGEREQAPRPRLS